MTGDLSAPIGATAQAEPFPHVLGATGAPMSETKDLSFFDQMAAAYERQNTGAYLDVKHPFTGDPIGLRILVAGFDGERMKTYANKVVNERIRERGLVRAEALEEQTLNTTVHAVLSWEWAPGVSLRGQQPGSSPDEVRAVLKALPFIAGQIDAFAGNLSNYLEKNAKLGAAA